MWYHTHINSLFYVIGNCCNVVEVNQEFARQILVAFAAEQTLFFDKSTFTHGQCSKCADLLNRHHFLQYMDHYVLTYIKLDFTIYLAILSI